MTPFRREIKIQDKVYRAAVEGAQECLTAVEPERVVEIAPEPVYAPRTEAPRRPAPAQAPAPEPAPQPTYTRPEPQPEPQPEEQPARPAKKKGPSWLSKWRDKVATIMTEPDDDSDYLDD